MVPLLLYVVSYALPDLADRSCHASVWTNISKYMKQSLWEASGHKSSQENPRLLCKIKNFSTTLHNSSSSDSNSVDDVLRYLKSILLLPTPIS